MLLSNDLCWPIDFGLVNEDGSFAASPNFGRH